MVYDLVLDPQANQYQLKLQREVFTQFQPALTRITTSEPGQLSQFMDVLQNKLDEKLEGDHHAPDAPTLNDLFGEP